MSIKNHILFKGLEDKVLEKIRSFSIAKKFSKNEIIYIQEDKAQYIYFIKSGWVKIFTETIDGEEAIMDVLPANHIFGDQAIIEGSNLSHSAESVEETEIVLMKIDKVRDLIKESTQFSMNILKLLAEKQKFRDKELEHLSLQNTPQRIGCFLLRLCKSEDESNITLNLPYDKSLIASRLGMKAETFSRALNKLKDETGISIKGSSINISSVSKLSSYCCSACSSSFPCEDVIRKTG